MQNVKLNNGMEMPQLGFGVFQITDLEQCKQAVLVAINNGYRLIDTAAAYQNETAVGEAIKESGVNREDLFITSKLWVSNFYADQLKDLELTTSIKPVVNQIEVNPWYQQPSEVDFANREDIRVEAWAPFAEGKHDIFTNETIAKIAKKYNKTNGQVILRWLLQRGIVVIPKSVHEARIKENIDVFDFELSADDIKVMSSLDKNESQFFDHRDPVTIEQIFGSSLAKLK